MICPQKLTPLACSQLGVSFLQLPWAGCSTTLTLVAGGGAQFPVPTNGTSFWVEADGSACGGCCARLEVIARSGDVLTLRAPNCAECSCLAANTRIRYAHNSVEHMRAIALEVGINVVAPLRYDCATRTLSVNCEELRSMLESPCGS
jgi:hypothetical protein